MDQFNQKEPPRYGCDNNGQNPYGGGNQNPYGGYNPPPFNNEEYYGRNDAFASDAMGKSRGIAALLAIFLGGLGIHYFYLGKNKAGIITLLITLLTCGIGACIMEILTIIQGILMFTMTNAEFDRKYVYNPASFPLF